MRRRERVVSPIACQVLASLGLLENHQKALPQTEKKDDEDICGHSRTTGRACSCFIVHSFLPSPPPPPSRKSMTSELTD